MTGDFYTDGKRYLYISPDFKTSKVCPFLVHEVRFGLMSFSAIGTVILSIPSIKQQYSIPKDSDHLECKFHEANYVIWHTAGGYLVSFSGEGIPMTTNISSLLKHNNRNRREILFQDIIYQRFISFQVRKQRSPRHTHIWEFASNLRSDLVYTQLRYEMDFVLKQINKNLVLIQNSICESLLLRWSSLYPPDLPRKIAIYTSHSPYPLGEFKDSIYKVTSTVLYSNKMSLNLPLIKNSGMYQVLDLSANQTLWIEPVTGILFKTHYSMVATWLPLANGSGFDPLTGRILLTQATNTYTFIFDPSSSDSQTGRGGKGENSIEELKRYWIKSDSIGEEEFDGRKELKGALRVSP